MAPEVKEVNETDASSATAATAAWKWSDWCLASEWGFLRLTKISRWQRAGAGST